MLATRLPLEELCQRQPLEIFRKQDDLDWFTGATFEDESLGAVILMNHDNNPLRISVFYVDAGQNLMLAIDRLKNMFSLTSEEVSWLTPFAATGGGRIKS